MTARLVRVMPAVAVATALVGAGLGVVLREPAYGLVEVEATDGLTLSGDQGRPTPGFDLRDLAPQQGESRTFVVTRTGRPLPATLHLDATDLVDDEGECPESETDCGDRGELSSQLSVRVQHADYTEQAGCGPRQDAGEVTLAQLATDPLLVRLLRGSATTEQVCVVITASLPDLRENNAVQGDRAAFGLRFTASSGGT